MAMLVDRSALRQAWVVSKGVEAASRIQSGGTLPDGWFEAWETDPDAAAANHARYEASRPKPKAST